MAHIIDESSCKLRCCNKCDMYRKELQRYKDLAEKGLLVELCERPTKNTTELFYIYDRNIWSIKFEDIGKAIKRRGITKFYTKFAEAEQALADMK